ncbi:DUF1203 domain-containing protein [Kribbella qitaiheensis]|nr:DUF1203 domain-containing protein [Kribbella qitaiheensis]
MNGDLEYLPVPAPALDRIRCNDHDDYGNSLIAQSSGAGAPLRCCLRMSTEGEQIALIAYQPSPLGGPYAEIGPVFIHVDECSGPALSGFPLDFLDRRAVLRPYDAAGLMLDGVLAEPGTSEGELKRLFDDPAVELVHVRNVIAGCWNFSVRRSVG